MFKKPSEFHTNMANTVLPLKTLFPPKASLKNLIINVLMQNHEPLNVNEIKREIKANYRKTVSYQGVYKILFLFAQENVVIKEDDSWRLKKEWVYELKETINEHKEHENIAPYTPKMTSISINTISEALDFFVSSIKSDKIRNNGKNLFLCHLKNVGLMILSKEQREVFKQFAKNNECHIMIENDNFVNRFCAKYFKSLGMNVYMGVPRSTPQIIMVYGNTLINIFFHFDIITYMTNKYKRIKSISEIKDLNVFDSITNNQNMSVTFTFEIDKVIVNQTRKHLMRLIDENKSLAIK